MDLAIFVLCVNSRSCFFSKTWHPVDHSDCAAGIAAGAAAGAVVTHGAAPCAHQCRLMRVSCSWSSWQSLLAPQPAGLTPPRDVAPGSAFL